MVHIRGINTDGLCEGYAGRGARSATIQSALLFDGLKWIGRSDMCRIVLGAAAALLAFGMAVAPARADDRDLCNYSKNEGSMAACNRLLQQAPNDVVAYNGRGLGYYLRRDYDRAIADFDQALRLNPSYPVAYGNRGLVSNDKHQYDRAIADLDQAIRLAPKDAIATATVALPTRASTITTARSATTNGRSS